MTTRRLPLIFILSLAHIIATQATRGAPTPPTSARVLDPDVNINLWPYPKISPDGKWIAYVAYGFVCVCNVAEPAPCKIIEVPNSWSWSHFTVPHGESLSDSSYGILAKNLTPEQRDKLISEVTKMISGFNWTYDSTAFVFSVQSMDADHKGYIYDTYLAEVDGKLTKLLHASSDITRIPSYRSLTRDQRFLVSEQQECLYEDRRPSIWNVEDNKPHATPFLYLTASAKSGRWLGIEKDTRQLVIADENFDVIKRFEEYQRGPSYGFKLDWSPDERFAIWRNAIGFDYYSNWEGFWLNLDTDEKRPLAGQYMEEQIGFTGRGGEFFRCGVDGVPSKLISGTQNTGAHLTVVPGDAKSPPRDLWRITVDPKGFPRIPMFNQPGYSSVHLSSGGSIFAIRIPQSPAGSTGLIWTLVDRDSHQWRCPGEENKNNVSPYDVVGFANDGNTIIAYDKKQLFAIPVESIKDSANKVSQ